MKETFPHRQLDSPIN